MLWQENECRSQILFRWNKDRVRIIILIVFSVRLCQQSAKFGIVTPGHQKQLLFFQIYVWNLGAQTGASWAKQWLLESGTEAVFYQAAQ